MKKSISIHAILTNLSPLHISSPESFRYEIDPVTGYGRVNLGTKGGIACAGIQRRRFANGAVEGVEFGVPFIAANNIIGRLRRQASQITLDAVRARKEQVNLTTYAAITCGAITGIPDKRDLTYAEYQESAEHPLIGLFGGGPRMLRRRAQMLDVLPVMTGLREGGYTVEHPGASHAGRPTNNQGITYGACFKRGDDISDLLDVDRMAASVKDFEAAFLARQALVFEDKKSKDEDAQGKRYSTKAWSSFEFIAPGVDFDFTVNLNNVTDAQIGLFLLSLDGLSKELIGGQTRNGLGRIKLQDVVIVDKTSGQVSDPIFNNNCLIKDSPVASGYLAAWSEAAKEITAERLDEIMKPVVVITDEEKQAKAEAKAAAAALKKASKAAAK